MFDTCLIYGDPLVKYQIKLKKLLSQCLIATCLIYRPIGNAFKRAKSCLYIRLKDNLLL